MFLSGGKYGAMSYGKGWLAYHKIKTEKNDSRQISIQKLCSFLTVRAKGKIIDTAVEEYRTAAEQILGITVTVNERGSSVSKQPAVPGVIFELTEKAPDLKKDGFRIFFAENQLFLSANTESGLLYAVFELARRMMDGIYLPDLDITTNPAMNLRMINHWDNMDGSIERGYSGNSFFFKEGQILHSDRIHAYVRLMASIGINAIVINNVNVHERESYLITDKYLDSLKKYADVFAAYGIQLYICVNFAASIDIGSLPTADPLSGDVISWWQDTVRHIYDIVPELGGFVVKADSEGRPGPFTYGRTQADGANMLGRALKPYGGLLIWRCFVYNCGQDWRDRKTDRAKASYDYFKDLDGSFEENVILQIKNGPMDFQIREPVSPLFGGLKNTNSILEVQIAGEYTGQQKDVCYLVPMWKEILEFETYAFSDKDKSSTVRDIVSGNAFRNINCGMAGVTNTGNDYNWTGNDLAAVNLYGYGRLCFCPDMTAEQIAREWITMTLSSDSQVMNTVTNILMHSRSTYEKYTVPLGIGWMVTPHSHYGPDVDGYEYDKWGTYHRADRNGLGVDRTKKGTGFTAQYNEPNASMYNNMDTCPEELLLFFHRVRYDKVLKTGKTLIQHIYDTHFEGVEEVKNMRKEWAALENKIPEDVFRRVGERFEMQMQNAVEWRDRINTYFYRMSGAKDEKGRKIY